MDKILTNLKNIEEWITKIPNPTQLKTNDDYMTFLCDAMSHTMYLLRLGTSIVSDEKKLNRGGYIKHQAIIAGHMVRLAKLYEGLLIHTSKRQLELALIFTRPLYETQVKIDYFLSSKNKKKTFKSYFLTSFKAEKEFLIDLANKAKKRKLVPIEKRIKKSVMQSLKSCQITTRELLKNKNWNIDGKNFKDILIALKREDEYSYAFGNSSRWVHGGWLELTNYHLKKTGKYYMPDLTYSDPDPRIASPVSIECLVTLINFLKWSKADKNKVITKNAEKLLKVFIEVDNAHEQLLNSKSS